MVSFSENYYLKNGHFNSHQCKNNFNINLLKFRLEYFYIKNILCPINFYSLAALMIREMFQDYVNNIFNFIIQEMFSEIVGVEFVTKEELIDFKMKLSLRSKI